MEVITGKEHTVHNNTTVGTNSLHGANVHLASSPSINGSLHKQPIELIFEILSPPLFPFYDHPWSCNKHHTTSIAVNQSFLAIFQNPPASRHSTGSCNSYTGTGSLLQEGFYRKGRELLCRKKTWNFCRISSSKWGRLGKTSLCMICLCKVVN